jgi:hypothetical protein
VSDFWATVAVPAEPPVVSDKLVDNALSKIWQRRFATCGHGDFCCLEDVSLGRVSDAAIVFAYRASQTCGHADCAECAQQLFYMSHAARKSALELQ